MNKIVENKSIGIIFSYLKNSIKYNVIKNSKKSQKFLNISKEDYSIISSFKSTITHNKNMAAYYNYYIQQFTAINPIAIIDYLTSYFTDYSLSNPIEINNVHKYSVLIISKISQNIIVNIVSLNKEENVLNNITDLDNIKQVNVEVPNIEKKDFEFLFDKLIPRSVEYLNFNYNFSTIFYETEYKYIYSNISKLTQIKKFKMIDKILVSRYLQYFGPNFPNNRCLSILFDFVDRKDRKVITACFKRLLNINELDFSFVSKPSFIFGKMLPRHYEKITSITLNNINMKQILQISKFIHLETFILYNSVFLNSNLGLDEVTTLKIIKLHQVSITLEALGLMISENPLLVKISLKVNIENPIQPETNAKLVSNALTSLKFLNKLSITFLGNDMHQDFTSLVINNFKSKSLDKLKIGSNFSCNYINLLLDFPHLTRIYLLSCCRNSQPNIEESLKNDMLKRIEIIETVCLKGCILTENFYDSLILPSYRIVKLIFDNSTFDTNSLLKLLRSLGSFKKLKYFSCINILLKNRIYPDLDGIFDDFYFAIKQCIFLEEFAFIIPDSQAIPSALEFTQGHTGFPFLKRFQLYPHILRDKFLQAEKL